MKNVKKTSIIIALLVLLLWTVGYSSDTKNDAAMTGFHLVEEPVSPKSIAMGTVGAALSQSSFSFYNPANPFLGKGMYFTPEYGLYNKNDLNKLFFEVVLPGDEGFYGISLKSTTISQIYRVKDLGNLPDYNQSFNAQFLQGTVNIVKSKWEDFAYGIAVSGIYDRIENYRAYALTFSGGAIYRLLNNRLNVGLSFMNFGWSTSYDRSSVGEDEEKKKSILGDGEKLPAHIRMGASWTDTLKNGMEYTGATDVVYRAVRDRDAKFTKHIKDRVYVPVGAELKVIPQIAVRLGKRFNFPTEIVNFGLGFDFDPLLLDISCVIPKIVDKGEFTFMSSFTYYIKSSSDDEEGEE